MAVLINNARVEWSGYEFGLTVGSALTDTGTLDEMRAELAACDPATDGARVVMRCVYRTEWMDAK